MTSDRHPTPGDTGRIESSGTALADAIRHAVDERLGELLAPTMAGDRLAEIMRYAALAPAKRARAIMLMMAAGPGGPHAAAALDAAAAVEMLHAASLILDDLPAMDDASLRRGQPTAHLTFGEDLAMLAAIGLIARAFAVTAVLAGVDPERRTRIVACLAAAIGPDGLVQGQALDLAGGTELEDTAAIEEMHGLKTGVLFAAAVEIGAELAGHDHASVKRLRAAAMDIGIAFQGFDDLIDARATAHDAGKSVGQDGGKATLVRAIGIEAAEKRAEARMANARRGLAAIGPSAEALAVYMEQLVDALRVPAPIVRTSRNSDGGAA